MLLRLGHRGARATSSLPENTLASFELALQHGCDGFELNVRLAADGCGIICHDPEFAGGNIARSNFDQLQQRRSIQPKHRQEKSQSAKTGLARLEDVLSSFATRAFLDIELKVCGLEDCLIAALRAHPPKRGYVVSSFLPEVLQSIRANDDGLPLGLISDREASLNLWPELPVDYVIPQYKLVTASLVDDVHAAGRKLFVWTVNDRERMLQLAAWGVDAIISDDTELLVQALPGG